jgi:replicative DNA helicase|tara:strand:- start:1211 stop:2596 length:1386 start_codon:yes stop_codon:yes gene_type:complete
MVEDQSIISSENFIIGSIIKDYPMTRKISNDYNLNVDHFESATAKEVWSVADFLYSSGKSIDAPSLIERIEEKNKSLDIKAVSSIIVDSLNVTTSTENISNHVETIIKKSLKKKAIEYLNSGIENLSYGEDLETIIATTKHQLSNLKIDKKSEDSIEDTINSMRDRYNFIRSKGCSGITSRWKQIQDHTAGYPFGKITVLGARPKMGKSTLALNEAIFSTVVERIPTVIFSLEMDKEELLEKAGSDVSEIDNKDLKLGNLSEEQIDKFISNGPEIISKCPLYIEDSPAQTVESICSKIREYSTDKDIKFAIVDYLQIISSTPGMSFQNRAYEIQYMTNQIRIAAKETGVAVILLSQISRPFKGKDGSILAPMPEMHDLKDSGAIEQDAYIIMFIGPPTIAVEPKPSWINPNVEQCTVRVAANRGGSTGEIHMMFNKPHNKFLSMAEYQSFKQKRYKKNDPF